MANALCALLNKIGSRWVRDIIVEVSGVMGCRPRPWGGLNSLMKLCVMSVAMHVVYGVSRL